MLKWYLLYTEGAFIGKYRVVNFSGTPYGTPDAMYQGREDYFNKHKHKHHPHQDDAQLNRLSNELFELFNSIHTTLSNSLSNSLNKKRQKIFYIEQVIGRVTRILNRPEQPTAMQKALYLDNLSETLKLAAELSFHEETWTFRSLGHLLMWIAAAAAMTAIVSYFLVSSAPIAITAAVCSALLGGLGLYLQKFSNAANISEALSDVVHNVKPFPCIKGHVGHVGVDDDVHQCSNSITEYFKNNANDIDTYLTTVSHVKNVDDGRAFLYSAISDAFNQRINAGDSAEELMAYLNESKNLNCERLAASCGIAIIPEKNTSHEFSALAFLPMEALFAEGGLDYLGAEDPTDALQKAYVKFWGRYSCSYTKAISSFLDDVRNQLEDKWDELRFGMN